MVRIGVRERLGAGPGGQRNRECEHSRSLRIGERHCADGTADRSRFDHRRRSTGRRPDRCERDPDADERVVQRVHAARHGLGQHELEPVRRWR